MECVESVNHLKNGPALFRQSKQGRNRKAKRVEHFNIQKNMYTEHNIIKNMTLAVAVFLFSTTSILAHFGARSPLGGTVSTAITYNGFVYLGTEEGGVFESTNDQIVAWRARPVGLLTGKISALAHSGSYLFAGTADGGVYIFTGYVGADRYWNRVNNGLGNLQISSLVAVDTITVLAGTNDGLYKTTDKGATWNVVNDAFVNGEVITGLVKAGSRFILTTLDGGVFYSDDEGDSWADFNDSNTLDITGTTKLSYNATTDELLVLNINGLFITASASTAGSAAYAAAMTGLPMGAEIRALSNNGTAWFLATDNGVFGSATASILWLAANTGLTSLDATAVVALPAAVVASINKLGVYKADAITLSWALTNTGFNNKVTHSVAASGDALVVAVTEDGVFVSTATGTAVSYVKANTGLTDSLNVNDVIFAGDDLVAATTNDGIFISSDFGANWSPINTGLADLNIAKLFYANGRVYAISSSGGLYVSDLDIVNWTALNDGLPNGAVVTSLAFQGNRIALSTLGDGVFAKDHFDASWSAFNAGLTNQDVTSVTASAGKFYAGTDGNGVFVTDMSTASWTATAATSIAHTTLMGLDGSRIQAMESYAGWVYASYKGGLLATSDQGATWEEAGNQFNLPSFTNVNKIAFVSTRVFVTTDNNGPYGNGLSELPVLPNALVLSDEVFDVPSAANTNFVSVTGNVPWTLTSDQGWLTTNIASGIRNGNFQIDAQENTAGPRTGIITVSSDSLSQTFTITVNQDGATGIADSGLSGAVRVFPNPNSGDFTVDLSAIDAVVNRVSIFDVNGKLLTQTEVGTNVQTLPFSVQYPAGFYFVRLDTDKGSDFQKVVIQ
jgi:hypothetical protein